MVSRTTTVNPPHGDLSARCTRWPAFVRIGSSCRCVIDVMLLRWVCSTRLLRTLITVCSASFHLLLLEFAISGLRPLLINWSLKYQGVERPNLQGVSFRPRFECGMTFPTLCLVPERWIGSRVQFLIAYPSRVFFSFPWRRCLWGRESNL